MTDHMIVEHVAGDSDRREGQPFLETHRALAACTREFGRLADGVVHGVAGLRAAGVEEQPVVRQSPGRCIVQLGPVALTVAWLRSTLDSVAKGELLVVVWQGAVAPPREHHPERTATAHATRSASVLWEQALTVVAPTDALWTWKPDSAGSEGYSSAELAAECVQRLGAAYEESRRAA